ncbi:MAG: HEAT repeat domain-containing protein, partial [Crocosphaera sp.]|nr:HEAT repeat domain-containing protein [Crocosphaera sp.]
MNNNLAFKQFQTIVNQDKCSNHEAIKLGLSILETGDFQQRWDVTKLLPKLGEDIIEPLIKVLENKNFDVEYRWFIARILGQFKSEKVVITFIKVLEFEDEDEEILSMVAEGLGNMGIAAIRSLENLLKTNNSSKLLAVKALGKIRHSEIIYSLLEVVNDSEPEIRTIAIECLGNFHKKELVAVFLKALKDPVSKVRKEAIIALARQSELAQEFNFVNQLSPLLYDINLEVAQETALALGKINTVESIQQLSIALQKKTTPKILKKAIVKALSWTENTQALNHLKTMLWQEDLELSKLIIVLLGTQKNQQTKIRATQILIDFLLYQNPTINHTEIKEAITVSLGELKEKIAVNSLKKLTQDPSKSVQLHA